jgi:hypothetical protein
MGWHQSVQRHVKGRRRPLAGEAQHVPVRQIAFAGTPRVVERITYHEGKEYRIGMTVVLCKGHPMCLGLGRQRILRRNQVNPLSHVRRGLTPAR